MPNQSHTVCHAKLGWMDLVGPGLTAFGLAVSAGVADACTLDQLLRLPLERLQQLRVAEPAPRRAARIEPLRDLKPLGAVRRRGD